MSFKKYFVKELNSLAGRTVEVAYDNTTVVGVIDYARDGVLALVVTTGAPAAAGISTLASYYGPTNEVLFIAIASIDFVRLL